MNGSGDRSPTVVIFMLVGISLPLEGKVGCGATRMRWSVGEYDLFQQSAIYYVPPHQSPAVTASPQGEAIFLPFVTISARYNVLICGTMAL